MQLKTVLTKYSGFQTLPRTSLQRKTAQRELEDECQGLVYMLAEIDKSVDAAEKNPQRFRLSHAELSERRKWVMATRRKVTDVSNGIIAGTNAPIAPPSTATSKLASAIHTENDEFIHSEGERQQLMIHQQDEELEDLSVHVVRIGELGREMGQELESQGYLIDELDAEMDGTSTRMAAAQRKVQAVLDKAGSKGQLIIIGALLILLIILIILVFT